MTPQKPFYREKKPFYSTMVGDGFNSVLGTGRVITAMAYHHWTDGVLVKTDG